MARKSKEFSPVSLKMKQTVFDDMERFCEYSGLSKTALIERAVSRYISMDADFQEYVSMTSCSDTEPHD